MWCSWVDSSEFQSASELTLDFASGLRPRGQATKGGWRGPVGSKMDWERVETTESIESVLDLVDD